MFSSFFSVLFSERGIKTQYKMNFPMIYNIKKAYDFLQIIGRIGEILFFLKHSDSIAINIRLQIIEINIFFHQKYFTCI